MEPNDIRPRIPLISLRRQEPGGRSHHPFRWILLLAILVIVLLIFIWSSKRRKSHETSVPMPPATTNGVVAVPVDPGTPPALGSGALSNAPVHSHVPMASPNPQLSSTNTSLLSPETQTPSTSNVIHVVKYGPSDRKWVALTFDDGPHRTLTPKVLEVLKTHNAKATFFVLGDQVKKHPQILPLIVNGGHELGNHTFSHRLLTAMSTNLIQSELLETQSLIKNAAGFAPELFRPPFGAYRASTKLLLQENQIKAIVLWSIDPEDWKHRDSEKVYQAITNKIQEGSIIVCHDIYPTTVNMLPSLIQDLKSRGYEFVTISQLCGLSSTNLLKSVAPVPVAPALAPVVTNASSITLVVTNFVTVTNTVHVKP